MSVPLFPTGRIGVRILTGKLSASYSPTGDGKFFFTMMATFAELERDIIHERTNGRPGSGESVGPQWELRCAAVTATRTRSILSSTVSGNKPASAA